MSTNMKRWNGSAWADFVPKRWNGSSWVNAVVKRWNGSSWAIVSEQRYVSSFQTTWTASYDGNDGAYRGSTMYQGRFGAPYTNYWERGRQRSMAGFNSSDIQSELNGAKIEKVEVWLVNQHFWYFAGGKALIGYHNSSSRPKAFSQTKYGVHTESFVGRGQGRWITLPNDFGNQLRDGKAKGFTLFADTDNLNYYGYFYGQGTGKAPTLRITYVK